MAKIEYSQIVRIKLNELKERLTEDYGREKAKAIMTKMTKGVRKLEAFPQSGIKISSLYDVDCDYCCLFVEHNYFFYRMKDEDTVLVLEMFHEKEDFMRKLFGIITTSQETIDYWDE